MFLLFLVVVVVMVITVGVIFWYPSLQMYLGHKTTSPSIWMYWENPPGKSKPGYIELCHRSVYEHCGQDFHIHLLDQFTLRRFLPFLPYQSILDSLMTIPQKTDYYRVLLLEKYGGIWLDSDTICFQSLLPIMTKLQEYDYVGFGCHKFNKKGKLLPCQNGYPKPANWAMASLPHGRLITTYRQAQERILKELSQGGGSLRQNYFGLGRSLLWKCIDKIQTQDPSWDYYHWTSRCVERDSRGQKWVNQRFLSQKEQIDEKCVTHLLIIPIYNTAPGFPSWFRQQTPSQILSGNMLVSRLFRLSMRVSDSPHTQELVESFVSHFPKIS